MKFVNHINEVLKPQITQKCIVLDLFAGCGGLSLGFEAAGFKTKEIIIKEQHNCKATGFWKTNSVKYNFLLLAHEYLFVFRK